MQVIEWTHFLENGLPLGENRSSMLQCSMTVGIFDGVHRGHQALIKRIISHNKNFIPVVVTFRQNHKIEADKERDKEYAQTGDIQNFQQRLETFEKLGIQIVIVVDFTEEFRRMKGSDFLEILIKHSNTGFFAVGSDFRCGYKLDTDASAIQKFFASRSIPVEIVPQVMEGSLPISSSRIRAAIAVGDIPLAKAMLGD
ncbi:MAG: FAD synthetase family protein [Treponema sp.]|nr:FAD synthetase family protein [Treponema sp.]MCL2252098.1 FAD synthetase family protein [Treponema sp.]